jgi:hypothetical protein
MKDLGSVRKVLGIRVQDGGELAMMFEQDKAVFGDPIYRRTCTEDAATDADVTRLKQPPDAPVKAVSRTIRAAKLHQLEQLVMADEPRVADLTQQRDVTFRVDDQAAFGVAHK